MKADRYWHMDILAADAAYSREVFDPTTVFFEDRELTAKLLCAYEKAAVKAAKSARLAINNPGLHMEEAVWDEAVAATLDRILFAIPRSFENEEIDGREEIEGRDIRLPRRR